MGRRVVDEKMREEKKRRKGYRIQNREREREREKKRKEKKTKGMVVVCSPSLCSTSDAKKRGPSSITTTENE